MVRDVLYTLYGELCRGLALARSVPAFRLVALHFFSCGLMLPVEAYDIVYLLGLARGPVPRRFQRKHYWS